MNSTKYLLTVSKYLQIRPGTVAQTSNPNITEVETGRSIVSSRPSLVIYKVQSQFEPQDTVSKKKNVQILPTFKIVLSRNTVVKPLKNETSFHSQNW